MRIVGRIALIWAVLSFVTLLLVGLVPSSADGVSCGALFSEQPLSFISDMSVCTNQRSLLKIPAIFAAMSAAFGLVVTLVVRSSAAASATAARPTA